MRLWLSIPAGAVVFLAAAFPDITWGWVVASLLVCGVLALAVSRSTASGPGLIVMLSGLVFVFSWLIVVTVVAVTVLVAVAGRLGPGPVEETRPGPVRSARGLLWRLAASPAVFILCYFVAGLIIYPFVEPYYQGRVMPEPLAIVSMQLLRALAIVGVAYPLLRTFSRRRDAVLVLALALPVFGVVSPMLPANDAMPAFIRLVHSLEMLPYYTLYGALVAAWFGPPRRRASSPLPASRAAAA
jgi:hypothetical protein